MNSLQNVLNRIRSLVAVGIVRLINTSGGVQLLQVQVGNEALDNVPFVECYGFTGAPIEGAEAVVLSLGGNRDKAVVIAVGDRRYRLQGLVSGEVAMYTDEGDFIHIKRGGTIAVKAKTVFEVDAPTTRFNGAVEITETLKVTKKVMLENDLNVAGISQAEDHKSGDVSGLSHGHGAGTFNVDGVAVVGTSAAPEV